MRLLVHVFDDLARQADAGIAAAEAAARDARGPSRPRRPRPPPASGCRPTSPALAARSRGSRAPSTACSCGRAPRPAGAATRRAGRARRGLRAAAAGARCGERPAASTTWPSRPASAAARRRCASARRSTAAHLEGRRRVVDLGCGRGELLEMLRDAGVGAYGVDTEPDFVDLVAEKGLEIRREDAVAHVEGLAPGDVDAIVASHLVEHMPPGRGGAPGGRGGRGAAEEGGLLILETPNPESLRRRLDQLPPRPDPPAAGAPRHARLPLRERGLLGGRDPAAVARARPRAAARCRPRATTPSRATLTGIAERLNGIIYGWQDYAVVARR